MDTKPTAHPRFMEALRFWLKLGFISFGGPTGQIAIMHDELVERRKWISESRFLHALNYCMLLPGPEAQQLAIYIGWLLHRTWGGIVAGTLFVLPSAVILWALSFVYVTYGNIEWVAAVFYGLQPAVLAIVASAVIRLGRKALKNEVMWTIAIAAFIAIFFGNAPFPAIIACALLIGLMGGNWRRDKFVVTAGHGGKVSSETVINDSGEAAPHTRPSLLRAVKILLVGIALWIAPLSFIAAWLGTSHATFHQGIFFSKAAMVTFGGAYAVLPYVSQQAVEKYQWVAPAEMLDGLGLAETTPGPLIMVLQFVGFLGAWKFHGPLPPLLSATLGAFITTWTTFVPCFLWILLGAPHIEQLRGNVKLSAALSTVTAAVVGVILNLAVWFGLHVLFASDKGVDWFAVAVASIAFTGLLRYKWNIVPVILGAGLLGMLWQLWIR